MPTSKVAVRCTPKFCAYQPSHIKKIKPGDTTICPQCGKKWLARLVWMIDYS